MPVCAQDAQLSQVYAMPILLNPAFTGSLDFTCRKEPLSRIRAALLQRSQYNGQYQTTAAAIDYIDGQSKWGLGFTVLSDKIRTSNLNQVEAGPAVSYRGRLSQRWNIVQGVQVTYNQRQLEYQSGLFPDQYTDQFYLGKYNSTADPLASNWNTVTYLSVNYGMMLYDEHLFAGLALDHLNEPNMSVSSGDEPLHIKISLQAGYKVYLRPQKGFSRVQSNYFITPLLHYKTQATNSQLDLGASSQLGPFLVGSWYRGMPLSGVPGEKGRVQNDALVIMAGVMSQSELGLLRLGFSYDLPLQQYRSRIGQTLEFTISYQPTSESCFRRRRYMAVPCPKL